MSAHSSACDLAFVDHAMALSRAATLRKLERQRKRGPARPRRPWIPRHERLARLRLEQSARVVRRDALADTPIAAPWDATLQPRLDELYDIAEKQAGPELVHARTRACNADKLERVAAWAREAGVAEPEQFERDAEKLRRARRSGWWGQDLDTGAVVMRFADRSGLVLLDPSEARERQAVLIERLVPTIARHVAAGRRVYYAVFSEPNVEAGSLAFGKRHLFERFRRVVLTGAVPEIVGAFAVQEDPLAADLHSWNVHLNLILVVDPARCTPLPPDLVEQGELSLPGAIAKFPAKPARDRAPPGTLSYAKLHYLWGAHQVELRPIRGDSSGTITRAIKEVVKYSTKWVGQKQLDAMASDPRASATMGGQAIHGSCDAGRAAGPGDPVLRRPSLELSGARATTRARRLQAPAFVDWPEARVAEWIRANQRFRRVRGWGLLYRISKRELPPDPDKAGRIRWLGRLFISPRGVVVHAHFARFIDLVHGDKSARDFSASSGRSPGAPSRAGPGDRAAAS